MQATRGAQVHLAALQLAKMENGHVFDQEFGKRQVCIDLTQTMGMSWSKQQVELHVLRPMMNAIRYFV